jgi:two-component system, OmpR family, sensor kinase
VSIRLRLALWYTAFLAIMFLIFAPTVYYTLERELSREVDRWLAPLSQQVLRSLDDRPDLLTPTEVTTDPTTGILVPTSQLQRAWLEQFTASGVFVELLDPNGRRMAASGNLQGRAVPVPSSAFAAAWWGSPDSYTTTLEGERFRGMLSPIPGQTEPRGFILVSHSLEDVDEALLGMRILLVAGNAFGLFLAVVVGWAIARSGLNPVEEITRTARAIAQSQEFGRRLKVGGSRDEVGRLAVTFNEMLASLDNAMATQKRFVADASHELRSPLTSIRSNIEILRRTPDAPIEDRTEALDDVAAEVDRMSRLISDLLLLARADAGHRIEMGRVALDALAMDVHHQMSAQADGVTLHLETAEPLVVHGNATWLKQLLLILVDNALKYTPRGGTVTLSVGREGDSAAVRVRDNGIGIAAESLPFIFDRFYRADKARGRDEGGTGIGLAIAKWIAEEHGGRLAVQSEPGAGSVFSLYLPRSGTAWPAK